MRIENTLPLAADDFSWKIGEEASAFTKRFSRGRCDHDFASKVGMSQDQIRQRRRVYDRFNSIRDMFSRLSWSHFYAAVTWEDAVEWLAIAERDRLTVSQMRHVRRRNIRRNIGLKRSRTERGSVNGEIRIGGVYFFLAKELSLVKIGKSRDIRARLKAASTFCPVEVEIIAALRMSGYSEPWIHRRFRSDHVRGEWFNYSRKMVEYLAFCERQGVLIPLNEIIGDPCQQQS